MTDNLQFDDTSISYSDLIKEAYIDPIRSALIIDDNYPTWDTIDQFEFRSLNQDGDTETPPSISEFNRVINDLKSVNPALIIDTRAGLGKDDIIENTLHQSDLLVLDYHLQKDDDGETACKIIQRIANNQHFNMVVLHTAEPNLEIPYIKILTTLIKQPQINFHNQEIKDIESIIDDIEAKLADKSLDKLSSTINNFIILNCLDSILLQKNYDDIIIETPELKLFDDTVREFESDKNKKYDILKYYTINFFNKNSKFNKKSDIDINNIKYSKSQNADLLWIRTDKIFIVFVKKYKNGLFDKLREAIEDWGPSPSRLISSKLRTAISSHGVIGEDIALSDKIAQFAFYRELKRMESEDNGDGLSKDFLERYISIHMENLFDSISPYIHNYALSIIKSDKVNTKNGFDQFEKKYNLPNDITNKNNDLQNHMIRKNFNAYVSTKAIKGWHLQCGHILKIDEDIWVCLSPACDLVPGQKKIAHLTNIKPFTAVKLHPVAEGSSPTKSDIKAVKVNSNNFIFLNIDDNIKTYCLYKNNFYGAISAEVFYAKNNGIIKENKYIEIISIGDKKASTCEGSENLTKETNLKNDGDIMPVLYNKRAQITHQLRYEYALNLLQKFSGESSRVGLDFSS